MSLRTISRNNSISESCGRKCKELWLRMGNIAKIKTRPKSVILGWKSKITESICKMFCSPPRNSVRKQPYDTQIAFNKFAVRQRQLQRKIKEYTPGGYGKESFIRRRK
ncbi:hypothetical protein BJ878DRAFT_287172 [Calycina marina]|uniref:Uncharacterized protein n=1 Tax=Calycina marina TaxID=1763456 RepID=A0A9P7ZB14_9HELO|nr:hypothetical protein BJ878DRAFT_287172 [Calycina marina]